MRYVIALLALCLLPLGSTHAADKYSMEDLAALEKTETWIELIDHATDIPPSKRDKAWEAMVEKAANAVLAQGDASSWTTDTLKKKFPFLAKSKAFSGAAGKVDTADLKKCFQDQYNVEACMESARKSAKNGDGANALAVAKVASLGVNRQNTAGLFQLAVEKNAPGVCEDEDLRLATVAALGLPADHADAKAAQVLTEKCWASVEAAVNDAFNGESKDSYFMKNACPVLKKKGELKGLRAKRCA